MDIKERITLDAVCANPRLDTRRLGEKTRLPAGDIRSALDGLIDQGCIERVGGVYLAIAPIAAIRALVNARLNKK